MELINLKDIVNYNCIIDFEFIEVDKPFSMGAGDINIIHYDVNNKNHFTGFIDSSKFESQLNNNVNETITILSNDYDIGSWLLESEQNENKIRIINDSNIQGKRYIVLHVDVSYGANKYGEATYVIVAQNLDDYEQENKVKFRFKTNKRLKIKIEDNFLLQNISKTKNNITRNIDLTDIKKIPMIVNPIVINGDSKFFFNTLNYFHFFALQKLSLKSPTNMINKNSSDNELKEFFDGIEEILKNVEKITSAYTGMNEEQIKIFKSQVYAGSNVKEYTDWALYNLFNKSNLTTNEFEMFCVMCSSFLNSSYCFNGGMTEKHKWFLPFYFEFIKGKWYLCSTFYKFSYVNNKLEYTVANNDENFYIKTKIDFPSIPKEIKEINYSLDWKDWDSSGLNYKVNLLCGDNIEKTPFELLHNDVMTTNIIENFTFQYSGQHVSYEDLELEIQRLKKDHKWVIVNEEVSVIKIKEMISYTVNGHPNPVAKPQKTEMVFISGNNYNDVGKTQEIQRETIPDNNDYIEHVWTYSTYYSFTAKISNSFINKYYNFRVDSTLKNNNNFIANKFIFTYANWLDFLEQYNKNYKNKSIDLDIQQNELITIKGLFLPRKIYIDNVGVDLDIDANIGEININYLN